jgi:hypothetical protein
MRTYTYNDWIYLLYVKELIEKINMPLKPQSIRKGVIIILNGNIVEKQKIIDLSIDWSESQINFFKKLLKQGGETKINSNQFKIIPQEIVVNSKGEKDPGIIVIPGIDQRF